MKSDPILPQNLTTRQCDSLVQCHLALVGPTCRDLWHPPPPPRSRSDGRKEVSIKDVASSRSGDIE